MNSVSPVKKILILAANPKSTSRLRLDEEVREIEEGLKRSQHRDRFVMERKWAVGPHDVQRALLDVGPNIVHFCGHGIGTRKLRPETNIAPDIVSVNDSKAKDEGLVFEDDNGQAKIVSAEALSGLFELFAEQVECVLLNACYSEVQAEAIAHHIPDVIGMRQAVGDKAAIKFAVGFYDALGAGRTVEFAYKLGCNSIQLAGIAEPLIPILINRKAHTEQGSINPESEPSIKPVDLEYPEGPVPLDCPFYVERASIESRCYRVILKPGSLLRIKAPKLMGKTSLMTRTLHYAASQNYATVQLNLGEVESAILANLDQFLRWFCLRVGQKLHLENRLTEYWDAQLMSNTSNCTDYFEVYLLSAIECPLVLGLDEVDQIFPHTNTAADFFRMLRNWHEKGTNQNIWQQLRLVISHSTEVYIRLSINSSPFNVGEPIQLPEFTPAQVRNLATRYGLSWSESEVKKLMAMVGGHPYLIRLAMHPIARQEVTLNQLIQEFPTDGGIYGNHLRRHWDNLQQNPELADAIKRIMTSPNPVKVERMQGHKLHSMGLIKWQGGHVVPSCDLYRQYFSR